MFPNLSIVSHMNKSLFCFLKLVETLLIVCCYWIFYTLYLDECRNCSVKSNSSICTQSKIKKSGHRMECIIYSISSVQAGRPMVGGSQWTLITRSQRNAASQYSTVEHGSALLEPMKLCANYCCAAGWLYDFESVTQLG